VVMGFKVARESVVKFTRKAYLKDFCASEFRAEIKRGSVR
jgi:hypothetical protein